MVYQLGMIHKLLKLCWSICFLDNKDIVSSHDPSIGVNYIKHILFHHWMEDLLDKHIFERYCPKRSLKYMFELLV